MKRKPAFAPYIGRVSNPYVDADTETGVHISDLAYELTRLLKACRVDRETRKAHTKLAAATPNLKRGPSELLAALCEALQHYAPPYTTFGEREGAWGFWPDLSLGSIPRLNEGDECHDQWGAGDIYRVNDHGNVTCGRFDKRGRFHQYWSAV